MAVPSAWPTLASDVHPAPSLTPIKVLLKCYFFRKISQTILYKAATLHPAQPLSFPTGFSMALSTTGKYVIISLITRLIPH